MSLLKSILIKYLKDAINKIESDTCELNETQAMEIMSVVGHTVLSKDQACDYLHMSRSKFDELVKDKKLPKGKKVKGFKELIYYKDELDIAMIHLK